MFTLYISPGRTHEERKTNWRISLNKYLNVWCHWHGIIITLYFQLRRGTWIYIFTVRRARCAFSIRNSLIRLVILLALLSYREYLRGMRDSVFHSSSRIHRDHKRFIEMARNGWKREPVQHTPPLLNNQTIKREHSAENRQRLNSTRLLSSQVSATTASCDMSMSKSN